MTENDHQRQLVQWAKTQPWGQFLYHIPNETVSGRGWMTRNRQLGVRKGVPDLCLPIPMHGYHGLYIELKADKGRLGPVQARWLEALRTFGYRAEVCHGWEEAKLVLEEYMNADPDN